jgi:hypothetical protein
MVLVAKYEGKRSFVRSGIDGKIILKWLPQMYAMAVVRGFNWSRMVSGSCEHANKHSLSVKRWGFLDKLSYYQPLKKDSTPWRQILQF